ncbi:MAG TPA: bifunctional GNAT family N-acetyltransferase/ATP-binding protein [Miltoncostaeaceae bacterium]|nr:bifunctional GNAT family N-acetyltransferase/ATP-binding protein [Miltoncostaeaceae bacterium]
MRVWTASHDGAERALFPVAEVIEALGGGAPAVVAVDGSRVVGTCVARVTGERAWVLRIAIDPDHRGRGVGSGLLRALEQRLLRMGVTRIAALLPEGGVGHEAFLRQGYAVTPGVEYFEKREALRSADLGPLGAMGGRLIDAGIWDDLEGMAVTKELVERRLVLPLAEPALAERHGVVAPKAAVLFGPPGTGKTTFAKAVAGRLGWPFVELFPSRLAADGAHGRAGALRDFFEAAYDIEHLVLFIDEVDEIAGRRAARPDTEGVTNELLKAIPAFRANDERLLVCATNSVRDLDPALLRPGRFDYVLPIGPPDADARAALWRRFVAGITTEAVPVDELAAITDLFTPADVEFAARKAAQAAFERALAGGADSPAMIDDFRDAVAATRPTLTRAMLGEFEEDIERYARL